jgi:hypothetical protein
MKAVKRFVPDTRICLREILPANNEPPALPQVLGLRDPSAFDERDREL